MLRLVILPSRRGSLQERMNPILVSANVANLRLTSELSSALAINSNNYLVDVWPRFVSDTQTFLTS